MGGITAAGAPLTRYDWQNLEASAAAAVTSGARSQGEPPQPSLPVSSCQGQTSHSWTWLQGAEGVVREPVPLPGFISSQGRQIPNSWPFGDEEVGRGSTTPRAGALDGDSIPFVPGKLIEEDLSPSPHELKRAEAKTSGLSTNKPQDTGAVSGAEDPLGLVAALRERLQQMTDGLERVKAAADRLHERLDGPDAPLADRLHERLDAPDAPLADRLLERLDDPDTPLADSPQPDGAAIGCSKTSIRADMTEVLENRQSDMSESPCPCSSELPGALEPTEAVPKSMAVKEQPEIELKETSASRDFIPTASSSGLSNLSALISLQSTKRSPRCVPVWLKKEPVCVSVHNGQY